MERKMFFGAYPQIFAYAKYLRENMTKAEKILWEELRQNKLGVRFKSQHPMIHYIADFYSYALRLVIEIDGPIHESCQEKDELRTRDLMDSGNTVIRFTNDEVINHLPDVLIRIKEIITVIRLKLNAEETKF